MSAQKNAQFRDLFRFIVPSWLADRGPRAKNTGFKLLYSFGAALDGFLEWFYQGAQARMPGQGTPTAITAISRDRQIILGPLPNPTTYLEALQRWLDAWKHVGHPFEILRQIRRYLGPVRCRTVDNSGNWHTIAEDGTETHEHVPGSWDWDGNTDAWSRLWVILYAPTHWVEWESFWKPDYALWYFLNAIAAFDPKVGFLHFTIGQHGSGNILSSQIPHPLFQVTEHIRYLAKTWKPQHARVVNIILAFDPDSFDPGEPSTCPDGQWGNWTKGSSPAVIARNTTARYWEGVI